MSEETSHEKWHAKLMEKVADVSVAKALEMGYKKCPVCGVIHPGIRFMHADHKDYCSSECFQNRDRDL